MSRFVEFGRILRTYDMIEGRHPSFGIFVPERESDSKNVFRYQSKI